MLFAGSSVAAGDLTLFGVVAAGVLGNLVGSWIAYAVGYYGRIDLLEKNKLIHINPKHLKWADDLFARHGDPIVFFSRMLPIVRTFISLPAGVAKMPFWRFTVLTLLGCIPWVLMLALVGKSVGDNWEEWRGHLHYLDYLVVVAVIALGVYFLIKRRRGGGPGADEASRPRRSRPAPPALERSGRGPAAGPRARSRSASSRARRSCCRSPAPPTSSSSPGWRAGTGRRSTRSCARASRWRCTPAPRLALLIGQRRLIARGAARASTAAGRCCSASPSCRRRSSATPWSGRSSSGSAARGRPPTACSPERRRCSSPTPGRSGAGAARRPPADGLALGVAQAAALAPGVSRNGVTLAAARWRRFSRDQANLLSRTIALPIIVGATALKGTRLARRGTTPELRRTLGARRRRLLRLDPRLPAPDRPGRARPGAVAVRGLPSGLGGGWCCSSCGVNV